MKRSLVMLALSAIITARLAAQQGVAVSLRNSTTNPAKCSPAGENIFLNRTTPAVLFCGSSNVWTALLTSTTGVPATRTINTTSPLAGGGDMSVDRTFTCITCATSANNLSFFSATSSAQLAGLLNDETGFSAGALAVFSKSPTIETPTIASFANATHNHSNAAGGGSALAPATVTIGGTQRYLIDVYGTGHTIHLRTTDVDDGLYLMGIGGQAGVIGMGVYYDGANYVAKTTSTSMIQGGVGSLNFYVNSGLTIGNSYSPGQRLTITTTSLTMSSGVAITPNSTAGIVGTTTNDSASTGSFGEYITGTVAPATTALTTNTSVNVGANTNISLTAGDWDCYGVVNFTLGATTSVTNLSGGVSTTTGTLPAQDSYFDFETAANIMTATKVATYVCPTVRLSISGTTNVFLVTQATFTASTASAGGTIRCRRAR